LATIPHLPVSYRLIKSQKPRISGILLLYGISSHFLTYCQMCLVEKEVHEKGNCFLQHHKHKQQVSLDMYGTTMPELQERVWRMKN
jgi:hypothetical protein